jgi:phosphoribosyl 1,2-cyclic phosphodiesterase
MAEAKKLVLFHHEPANDDRAIDRILRDARRLEELTRQGHKLEVTAAYDGMEIDL